jgi:UDP-N-acetylmuramoyl-tripeptide--D-alanyl-D-alanine ligase
MRNKAEFTQIDLEAIFGKNKLHNINDDFVAKGVSTDTRELRKGNLFVAIKGEKYDSHQLVDEALMKGAVAAVVNENTVANYPSDFPLISAEDTIDALGSIANFHRLKFDIKLICIGGSNGKTTTKDMTASILSKKYKTLKTYRNFNNRIGVPMMLLKLDKTYQAAVIEIATNQPGEIAELSDIAAPNYGLITNIGKEHLEQLMDLRGVELEETFLFGYLRGKGIALVNADDEILLKYTKVLENFHTYGTREESQIRGEFSLNERQQPTLKMFFKEQELVLNLKTFGKISAINALAAGAAAIAMDVEPEYVKDGLESFIPDPETAYGRMRLEDVNGINIINDCYNANPVSMRVALETLKSFFPAKKKFAILGDMLELGSCSETEHINLIKYASDKADQLILFGREFKNALEQSEDKKDFIHIDNIDDLKEFIKTVPSKDDVVLVKGSRGMRLERIIEHLKYE